MCHRVYIWSSPATHLPRGSLYPSSVQLGVSSNTLSAFHFAAVVDAFGPNCCGKSTLLKVVMPTVEADATFGPVMKSELPGCQKLWMVLAFLNTYRDQFKL